MKFLDLRGLQTLWGQVLASRTTVSATESNNGARINVSGPGEGIAHNYVLSLVNTASTSDLSNLQNNLSAVATSGAASDVAITDTAGNFEATTVEGALAELASATGGGVASKTVHLVDASAGQSDYAKVYNLYQGSDTSDMSNNSLVGTINIPKDLVVQSGKTVTVTNGIDSDGDSTSVANGTYIKLVIQNQTDPLYINVRDLVDEYTGGSTSDIAVAISAANEITATLVAVDGAKLTAGSVIKAKLATAVQNSLDLADSAVQSVVEGSTNGTISVDGTDVAVHGLGSAAYTDTTAYDPAGSAAEVLGTNTDAASANTVYGAKAYANEVAASATSNKADKVTNPAAGNFAGLDINGNLTDSGKKAADFATAAQGAKADTAIQGVTGETAVTNSNYIEVSVEAAEDANTHEVTLSSHANVTTHTVSDAVVGTADGLATAADVKSYVDGKTTIAAHTESVAAPSETTPTGTMVVSSVTTENGSVKAVGSVEVEALGSAAAVESKLRGASGAPGYSATETLAALRSDINAISGGGEGSIADQIESAINDLDSTVDVNLSGNTVSVYDAQENTAYVLTAIAEVDGVLNQAASKKVLIEPIDTNTLNSILV